MYMTRKRSLGNSYRDSCAINMDVCGITSAVASSFGAAACSSGFLLHLDSAADAVMKRVLRHRLLPQSCRAGPRRVAAHE